MLKAPSSNRVREQSTYETGSSVIFAFVTFSRPSSRAFVRNHQKDESWHRRVALALEHIGKVPMPRRQLPFPGSAPILIEVVEYAHSQFR